MGEMYIQVQSQTFTKGTNKFYTCGNNIAKNIERSLYSLRVTNLKSTGNFHTKYWLQILTFKSLKLIYHLRNIINVYRKWCNFFVKESSWKNGSILAQL